MSDAYLRLTGVTRHYGQSDSMIRVLDGADLEVAGGEMVAIVAPSGAGKSTLLHVSGLLERPQAGEIEICGMPTGALSDRARTLMRRFSIGYVYQFHHLLPEFDARENVAMPQMIAGISRTEAGKRADELLELLGVQNRGDHRPTELSGGEQQRVAIARAAANNPRVILADEPTGNLDPATSDRVFDALMGLIRNEGVAALIATHNHGLARRADRVVTLEGGKIVPHTL